MADDVVEYSRRVFLESLYDCAEVVVSKPHDLVIPCANHLKRIGSSLFPGAYVKMSHPVMLKVRHRV